MRATREPTGHRCRPLAKKQPGIGTPALGHTSEMRNTTGCTHKFDSTAGTTQPKYADASQTGL
jgi:hypothetical protein